VDVRAACRATRYGIVGIVVTGAYHLPLSPLGTGLACKCPRCGRGKLYAGYLTLAARCSVCHLDLSQADSGDGPAVFLIFILGALAVFLAYLLLFVLVLPKWLSWLILVAVVLGGAAVLLRPAKAIMVALQYRNRAGGFGDS
jgi:uncharacterized protein (DUF983 family)